MSVEGDGRTGELLRLVGVSRLFHAGSHVVTALQEIHLSVRQTEFVSIMGPSGSGKSTQLNILGGLDAPTSGKYWLQGREIGGRPQRELPRVRNRHSGYGFRHYKPLHQRHAMHK